jgi:hypothetical protein
MWTLRRGGKVGHGKNCPLGRYGHMAKETSLDENSVRAQAYACHEFARTWRRVLAAHNYHAKTDG